ncbi:Zinc finger GRF-type protein [Arachis hypogaea]|nr:Zinc finger GRF-type protein [Arachis hypogaea]
MSMIGGGSTACGSSVRSPSSWNRMRTPTKSRRLGPPEWFGYGCRPVLRWFGIESNPNKPFYGCPNYNSSGKRWCRLFVWADSGNEEQVDKPKSCGDDYEVKMNFNWRLQRLEEDVHMQKVITQLVPCKE